MTAPSDQAPILIVEDDKKTASLIALYLEREGFRTLVAYDGETALELAAERKPMFVVLDLMLPRVDGWEVCRRLRKTSDVPILILTARDEEVDRVSGLILGADDYVVKPFSPRELVARVKAILRRAQNRPSTETKSALSHGGLILDPEKRKVTLDGQRVELTHHEFNTTACPDGSAGQGLHPGRAALLPLSETGSGRHRPRRGCPRRKDQAED